MQPVVESRPENQVIKSQASSSKPPENVEKSLGEIEKIKEESQSWKQKYQAKSVSIFAIYQIFGLTMLFLG